MRFKAALASSLLGLVAFAPSSCGPAKEPESLPGKDAASLRSTDVGRVRCRPQPGKNRVDVLRLPQPGAARSPTKGSCEDGEIGLAKGSPIIAKGADGQSIRYARMVAWGEHMPDKASGIKYGYVDDRFLENVAELDGGSTLAEPGPEGALQIAKAVVGFSYKWGDAALPRSSNTKTADPGRCIAEDPNEGCPACRHEGSFGADCSGLVGKAWQLQEFMPLENPRQDIATIDFYESDGGGQWQHLGLLRDWLDELQPGDALVRARSQGQGHVGHMVLFEKRDRWGVPQVYEAKGCLWGITYNTHSFIDADSGVWQSAPWKVIRRNWGHSNNDIR